jgi:hypothetical protein
MRDDMYKVIVERPRRGGGAAFKSEGRIYRNSEETAPKIGMKKGHVRRKWLNENLSPLKRFLASQIGRPWNKVYSELSNGIDRRNTVQDHIYAHIEQFVATKTSWQQPDENLSNRRSNIGDCVIVKQQGWRTAWMPLRECRAELYVHPCSGLLLKNPYYERWGAKEKREQILKERESAKQLHVVSATLEYRRIDEHWYEINKEQFPKCEADNKALRWDVLQNRQVAGFYPHWYAKRKRQISQSEIAAIKKAQQLAGLFYYVRSSLKIIPIKLRAIFTTATQHVAQHLSTRNAQSPPLCDCRLRFAQVVQNPP